MADIALFIFVRTDMASMTRGRIAAQASHAANQMVNDIRANEDNRQLVWLSQWEQQTTSGFGTVYVMDIGNYERLHDIITNINANIINHGVKTGLTRDPSYPLVDGDMVHLLDIITCGYAFGDKKVISEILDGNSVELLK